MSAQLRIVDDPTGNGAVLRYAPEGLRPGDMWRAPAGDLEGRECWCIVLPDNSGVWWTTYRLRGEFGWSVTGDPPNLTVTPSIDASARFTDGSVRGWHGFLTNGVLTP